MDRLTFTATAGIEGNTLSGVAHTYGTRTLRGNRYIEFAAGAFRSEDARSFWNHDTTLLLGRQSTGSLRLDDQSDGMHFAIDLPGTSYAADLKVLVERGDLSEMSFGVMPGAYTTSKAPDGKPVITYTSADLFDISPVSLPAFGTGTSIALHSEEPAMPQTIPEIMDAMQAAVDAGDTDAFDALEGDLKAAQRTEAARERLETYRKPIVGLPSVIRATPKGDAGETYAFEQYLRTGQPNHDLTFAQTVGSPGGGGYTVPADFRTKMTETMMAYGGFLSNVETLSTSDGRPIEWPSVDETPAAGAQTDAALRSEVVAETVVSTVGADLTFGTVTLGAYLFAATGPSSLPLKVSVELLQDSAFDIGAFVSRALGTRIGRRQARAATCGTGSSEPLGILSGTAGDVSESTLTYAKLNSLIHKLDPDYRQNAKWLFNDAVAEEIEGILDASTRPLLVPGTQGLSEGVSRPSLLGYPVIIDQTCFADATNVQYVAFGDFNRAYIWRNVLDVNVLVNPYSNPRYVTYDAWARADGVIQDYAAYVTIEGE